MRDNPDHMRQLGWAGFGPEEEYWECTNCKKAIVVDDLERHKHPCWNECPYEGVEYEISYS